MPTIPNGIMQVRLFITYVVKNIQTSSILYYLPQGGAPTTATDMVAEANFFMGELGGPVSAVLAEGVGIVGVYVRYKAVGVDVEGFSTDTPIMGDGGDDALPAEVCMGIQRRTGLPGRNKRGRIFISGIAEDHYSDGVLVSGSLATAQLVAAKFAEVISSAEFEYAPRHWDRKTNTMEPIAACKVLKRAVSRRDRVQSLPYQAV